MVAGGNLIIQGGNTTGSTHSIGGNLLIRAGTGIGGTTNTGGNLIIRAGVGTGHGIAPYPKNYIDGTKGKIIICRTKHTYTVLYVGTFLESTDQNL